MLSQATNHSPHVEDEIHLSDYWHALVRHRTLILGTVCVVTLLTVIVVLRLQNIYEGKAVIIPLGESTSGLQNVLGELGSLLPLGTVGSEDPSTRLLAILWSRTLAEEVIQRLNLLPLLYADDWDANTQQWTTDDPPTIQGAVRMLLQEVVVSAWDETKRIMTITVAQPDPVLAAAIANQFIEALQRALNENAFTLAKKNRVFIEAQLQKINKDLAAAEEALRQFEQTYGIVALDVQAQAAVNALAGLEAQIMFKEVQLGVWQRSLTEASQEVYLLQEELQGLRAQLARLLQGTPGPFAPSAVPGQNSQMFLSLDKAPDIKLQYARLQREALIQNKLFALLVQQLEQARIEEARDETAFQILDRAVPPEEEVKPKRSLIVALSTLLGVCLGIFLAFFSEYRDQSVRTREQVERQVQTTLLAAIPSQVQPKRLGWRSQVSSPNEGLLQSPSQDIPSREAFRYLHVRLKPVNGKSRNQVVLFTSAGADEGSTMTLANLAIVAAGMGERTLMVDSNVRQPALHTLFHCPMAPGLADILTSPERWRTGIQQTTINNLSLMPAGTVLSTTLTSLESPALDFLVAQLREAYDLILFDAPPVHDSSDAAVLGSKVDATCLVLMCGVSRLEAARAARTALEAVQVNVLGAVLIL